MALTFLASVDLLPLLGDPVVLVDERRTIHYANGRAQSLLSRNHVLSNRHGLMSCQNAQADGQLGRALSETRRGDSGGTGDRAMQDGQFLRLSDGADRFLALYLFAIRSHPAPDTTGPQALTLVLLHDPSRATEPDADLAAATWQLTAAEARAAVALARGLTPRELALQSGLSLNTIRSQIQAAMAKTGTRRQVQLVSLLLSMPQTPSRRSGADPLPLRGLARGLPD